MEAKDREPIAPRTLSLEEKKEFVLSTVPRMAEYTFPFLCSVFGIVNEKAGRHLGSGLRCALQGRRAILTAHHVIEKAANEPGGLAISVGYGLAPFRMHGAVHIDRFSDLAVYFLPQDYPDNPDVAFWPGDRMDREQTKLATDYLFLHGFPGDCSYSSQLLKGVLNRSLPYGAMQRIDNLPDDLKPLEFAIEFDPIGMSNAGGTVKCPVDPHGLSGSPVWRIGASGRPAARWRPEDSMLVGVVTQWREMQNVLVATSISGLPSDW
jgi:hypothetical protein